MFALTALALLAAASPALAGYYGYAPAYATYGYAPTYATYGHYGHYAAPYTTYAAPAVTTVHKTFAAPAYTYTAPVAATVAAPVVKTVAPVATYAATPGYYGFGYGGVYAPVIKK